MNTIEGRAEDTCAEPGAAGCREHPASDRRSRKLATRYLSDLRERIRPPSAKKYTRTHKACALAITTSEKSYEINDRAEGKLLAGPASRTTQFLPHMLKSALRGCHPVMVGIRRIIPNVLLMLAFQFRHPVAVHIHMKPNDLAQNPGRLGFHWPHASILRAFLRPSLNFL
jgi:hypothetical protein